MIDPTQLVLISTPFTYAYSNKSVHRTRTIFSDLLCHGMASPLEALPVELIEHIVTLLDFRDIAALRLTSRTLDSKASQGSFTAFFKYKNIELTTRILQELVQVTSQSGLGCLLQHCTITGIARNETAAPDGDTELLRLLTEAFCNLRQRSKKRELASLRLRVAARIESQDGTLIEPDKFRSWSSIWDAALRAFNVTTTALNESQLPIVGHLDIFGSLRGCSLSCDAFSAFADTLAATHVYNSLKRLTVSLSAVYKATMNDDFATAFTDEEAQSESRHLRFVFEDILQMLQSMPELQCLDLHWYNIGNKASISAAPPSARQKSGTSPISTRLKECSLRGIYTTESALLQFLQAVHPTMLTLTDVRLISGTYAPIFEHLTGPYGSVMCYHLDDLHEGNALVHFDVPGSSKFRYRGGNVGPSSLTRQTDDARQTIRYRFAPGRALGSGERMRWLKSKAREFGSVTGDVYDFIELNAQTTAGATGEPSYVSS